MQQKNEQYEIKEYKHFVNLYNVVPAGSGAAVTVLRKIADKIVSGQIKRLPSILLYGAKGKHTLALAMANSLCSEDVRECHGRYFNCSDEAQDFWKDSFPSTVHIIQNLEKIHLPFSVGLWNYLAKGYYTYVIFRDEKVTRYCNGLILMTSDSIEKIPEQILQAIDIKIKVEAHNREQLRQILIQRLKFINVDFDNKAVDLLVENCDVDVEKAIQLLWMSIVSDEPICQKLSVDSVKNALEWKEVID